MGRRAFLHALFDMETTAMADAETTTTTTTTGTDQKAGSTAEQTQQQGQSDKGFPADTPVAEMNDAQRAEYYKFHSRKHEAESNRYKSLGDPDTIKAKIAAADAAEQAKLTPSEQAITQARAEARAEAFAEANGSAVTAILEANLVARGKSAEQAAEIAGAIKTSAFIADGKVDTAKVVGWANGIAGEPGDAMTGRKLDMGQGNRGTRNAPTGVQAGRDLYAATHGGGQK